MKEAYSDHEPDRFTRSKERVRYNFGAEQIDGPEESGSTWKHKYIELPEEIQTTNPVEMRSHLSIGPVQIRRAIRHFGLTSAVDAYLASQSEEAQEDWAVATEIKRLDPMILGAQAALGLTDEQADELFFVGMTMA